MFPFEESSIINLPHHVSITHLMIINSHEINIETHGPQNGRPVIFLHHGLGSTQSWRDQISSFVDSGFFVICYDRWGYGKSDIRSHLNVPGFYEDLADLREIIISLQINFVSLIGHSDGGTIGLYFAALYPESVSTLVTIAAHIYIETKMKPSIVGIKKLFISDQRFRNGLERAHGGKFETTFNNWFDGWHASESINWDMRPLLSEVKCPALIIQGIEDEHATSQHAKDIAKNIPDATLWMVPGGKHMVPQELPTEFNKRVIAFLKSNLDAK